MTYFGRSRFHPKVNTRDMPGKVGMLHHDAVPLTFVQQVTNTKMPT